MSTAPFDIDQVITRLRDSVPQLQKVEGAASYAAIRALPDYRVPCAYAVLTNERPDQADPKNRQQRAIVTFGVAIAVRNYRDHVGGEVKDALRPLLTDVRSALIGWTPAELGSRPVKWIGGDVIDYDNNTLLWGEVYQTQHFIGAA